MNNDVIILGGNTPNNVKWLKQMEKVYKKDYNVSTLSFDNWKDSSMLDFELGLPLKFSFNNHIDIKRIFNKISSKCKILIIQQKFDPQGSVRDIIDMLGETISIKPISGNKHIYANYLSIKKAIDLFIKYNL